MARINTRIFLINIKQKISISAELFGIFDEFSHLIAGAMTLVAE
jgi:hypothetical protein